MESGSSTNWSWGTSPFTAIDYQIEVDYLLDFSTDSGTGGSCATAVGGISVDGTFTPNVLVAETTGTICDTYDGNLTYSGSYVVLGDGDGLFTDASGSGALTFGIADTIDESVAHNSPQEAYGQLQMTGNLSLTTAAPACNGIAGAGSDC